MPSSASERCSATPKATPRPIPSAAPSRAMTIDSSRSIRLSLAAAEPDGAEQPDLAGPLDHRQRQGVDDAEDGDDDGQAEQGVDEVEHLVDLAALLVGELALVFDRDDRQVGERPVEVAPHLGRDGAGLTGDEDERVGLRAAQRLQRRQAQEVVGRQERGLAVDRPDRERLGRATAGEVDLRADLEPVRRGPFLRDRHRRRREVGEAPRDHRGGAEHPDVARVDPDDAPVLTLGRGLDGVPAERRDLLDAGDGREAPW